ncbi:gem-associated protein 2-like [Oryza brachyantha]|uniref:Gem-associated protein 2 n=1 Tax=Oryza brachyantha TaxID=4533 RepID=J3N7J5_ORYBR|nr:gem-associated protein 2-like [Oryza brachyantha]
MADASAVTRTRYTRGELEALRAAPSEEAQARVWAGVCAALAAAGFSGEYDALADAEGASTRKAGRKGKKATGGGWRQHDAAAPLLETDEIGGWRSGDSGLRYEQYGDEPRSVLQGIEEPFDQGGNMEYEDNDSDDDYDGILKPAFAVDGEPDFESGDPVDGFEYLRRVRWEANQIPRVKVAKIDLSTPRNEQTTYMPEIPDIPKCSPDLSASKHWEDTFITYFSETRLAFSELDSSDGPSVSGGMKNSLKLNNKSEPQTDPTLTMIRNMDAVSRAATLRNYIYMIQSLDKLSRNDCLWLFALCVAVDTPLDAETCASLRSLLRKCANILATKSVMDDEVAMLNILIAIAGRFFGQYDNH